MAFPGAELPAPAREALARARISSAKDLLGFTELQLVKLLDMPLSEAQSLRCAVLAPQAWSLLEERQKHFSRAFTPTLSPALDEALGGGVSAGSLTEIVGEAGVGKTQLCLSLAVSALAGAAPRRGDVIYIDTENKFSADRLVEIAQHLLPDQFSTEEQVHAFASSVIRYRAATRAELETSVDFIAKRASKHGVRLVVVDSIAAVARAEFGGSELLERQHLLSQLASRLKRAADLYKIPVVVTNQVHVRAEGASDENVDRVVAPALGNTWSHAVNTRLLLAYRETGPLAGGDRVLVVTKSPTVPQQRLAYRVTAAGLQCDLAS